MASTLCAVVRGCKSNRVEVERCWICVLSQIPIGQLFRGPWDETFELDTPSRPANISFERCGTLFLNPNRVYTDFEKRRCHGLDWRRTHYTHPERPRSEILALSLNECSYEYLHYADLELGARPNPLRTKLHKVSTILAIFPLIVPQVDGRLGCVRLPRKIKARENLG